MTPDIGTLLNSVPIAFFASWQQAAVYAALCLFSLAVFAVMWRREGFINIPGFQIYILAYSNILLLPFVNSPLNLFSFGLDGYYRYLPLVPKAFALTALGYVIMMITFVYAYKRRVRPILIDYVEASVERWWMRDDVLVIAGLLIALMTAVLIAGGVPLFRGREAGMLNSALRPLINIQAFLASFTLLLAFGSIFLRPRLSNLFAAGLAIFACILGGQRSVLLVPVAFYIILHFSWRRSRNIMTMFIAGLVLVGLLNAVNLLRGGSASLGGTAEFVGRTFFYGNNFSDLRDFSLILSGWNGELLFGTTLIAGMLGFVPSFLMPLRQEWAWGPFSLNAAGLYDPLGTNPGLRGTFIAEPYLGFGFIGIVVMAIIAGFIFAGDSAGIEDARKAGDRRKFVVCSAGTVLYTQCLGGFFNSAGFFSSYQIILVLLVGLLLADLVDRRGSAKAKAAADQKLPF